MLRPRSFTNTIAASAIDSDGERRDLAPAARAVGRRRPEDRAGRGEEDAAAVDHEREGNARRRARRGTAAGASARPPRPPRRRRAAPPPRRRGRAARRARRACSPAPSAAPCPWRGRPRRRAPRRRRRRAAHPPRYPGARIRRADDMSLPLPRRDYWASREETTSEPLRRRFQLLTRVIPDARSAIRDPQRRGWGLDPGSPLRSGRDDRRGR